MIAGGNISDNGTGGGSGSSGNLLWKLSFDFCRDRVIDAIGKILRLQKQKTASYGWAHLCH